MYMSQDINVATNYVKECYHGQEDKRYGLLASSKSKNLPRWGIRNEYNYTKNCGEKIFSTSEKTTTTSIIHTIRYTLFT